MLKSLKAVLGIHHIRDYIKDFSKQYADVHVLIYKYLSISFEQFLNDSSTDSSQFSENMHSKLAVIVMDYLLGKEKDDIRYLGSDGEREGIYDVFADSNGEITEEEKYKRINEITLISKHVEKWADEVMKKHKDICELVVQTLRMKQVFESYAIDKNIESGFVKYSETDEGQRVSNLIAKYGITVPLQLDPIKYAKLLNKWYIWDESVLIKEKAKFGKSVRVYKLLDTEGLKMILFPVLEKFYPQNVLNVIKADNDLLFCTPYFTYIYLLQKYDHLNSNNEFRSLTMKKKLEYFIIDRGAGNDTAFTQKEKEMMLQTPINDYNDIIFTIIDCEQSNVVGEIGYPWKLAKDKFFFEVIPQIEEAYLKFRGIEAI